MTLAESIAKALGNGKEARNDEGWLTCCPVHGDKNPSMSIWDKGDSITVDCKSGGCSWKEIKNELVRRGLLPAWEPEKKKGKKKPAPKQEAPKPEAPPAEKESMIWKRASKDGLEHAKRYFAGRGITIDPLPVCFKWTSYKDKQGEDQNVIVAAASKPDDKMVYAVQRLFIDLEDNSKNGAKMHGPCEGRAVWFNQKGEKVRLLIGEGIETTMSAIQATGTNGAATLSTSGMKNVILPEETEEIYILVDSDPVREKAAASMPGQKAAYILAHRFQESRTGRVAFLVTPDDTCFTEAPAKLDFNDLLIADPSGDSILDRMGKAVKFSDLSWQPPGSENQPFKGKSYDELLAEAQALDKSSVDKITTIIQEASILPVIPFRLIKEVIKKQTGIPFSVLDLAAREHGGALESSEEDDLRLAQGLVEKLGRDNLLATPAFVYSWGKGVWERAEDIAVKQWVQGYIGDRDVYTDAVHKNLVASVADLFRTEIFKSDHQFDLGPSESVNVANGELVLNRETNRWSLLPHNREHFRTTQIPVEYDETATCPKFEKFLGEIFKGDSDATDKIKALLEMLGYTLMSHCRHEKFVILVGAGANGKSVFLVILEALVGSQNIAGVQPSQFDRSFQRAHLHGKLANIVTEIRQGEVIEDAALKGIVSGEPTTVEHKFKNPFVMRPFATCWFGTNHMPHTRDFSDALFRRALVVEFNQIFKPEFGNCDPQLKDKLVEELPGILNAALSAYAGALVNGFTVPKSCLKARENWRLEADQVAQFVDDECEQDSIGQGVGARELYRAYQAWGDANGIRQQLGSKAFRDRLTRLGYGQRRTKNARLVTGIRLNPSPGHEGPIEVFRL